MVLRGPVGDLANPGQFKIVQVGRESVLVSAAATALLRAFLNVCRHRGAHCAPRTGQVKRTLQCPYHAWTYGLDGKLIAAPNSPLTETRRTIDRTSTG